MQTREKRRNPVAPFITSTLQQESSRKLRFSVKRTMMLAQRSLRRQRARQRGRSRSDHLHAYRFDACLERCDRTKSVDLIARAVRSELCSRQRRTPTRARKTFRMRTKRFVPTSVHAYSGERRELPGGRRTEALSFDLDALRRVADDACRVRSDHDRSYGEGQATTASIVSARPVPFRSSTASSRFTKKARIRRTKTTRN